MPTRVAYLSHPIGSIDDDPIEHGDNIADAGIWLGFLVAHTNWAVMCPWLAYIVAGSTRPRGPRALVDQIALLERCDLIVQVGGRMSGHMKFEHAHAERRGIPVVNLLDLGKRPALAGFTAREVRIRAMEANIPLPRSSWSPELPPSEIDALRAAELVLARAPELGGTPEEVAQLNVAREVIAKIVKAALV
jgi:hypothetical protein